MSFCTNPTTNDKLFIQPFEVCSIIALKELHRKTGDDKYVYNSNNIFNDNFITNNTNINNKIRNKDANTNNEYIYNYDYNKKDLCYNINKTDYAINCAIQNLNPLYTYNKKTGGCSLIPLSDLPNGFKLDEEKDKSYIYYDNKDNDNPDFPLYVSQKRKAYCENTWFDWMIVPNFHFGNQYEKDSGKFSKMDVRKCYKPCGKGMMPYITNENKQICIPKIEAEDGLYRNKLDFSPIALINLIGNTQNTIEQLYNLIKIEKYNNYNTTELTINDEIINNVDTNGEISNCYQASIISLFTNIISKETINIPIENNKEVLSYKNPLFNETDENLLTLRGMANSKMMNHAILVHTYLLAYNYNNFISNEVKNANNYYENDQSTNINFDKIEKFEFNIYNTLKPKFDAAKNQYLNNDNKLDKYYQRLANILYKAINICYNDETAFSKNLILETETAFANIKRYVSNDNSSIKYDNYMIKNEKITDILPIEIQLIDIPTIDKIPLREYLNIALVTNTKTNDNEKKKTFIDKIFTDFYNKNDNQKVFFYTQEIIEKKGGCKAKHIPNPNKNDIMSPSCLTCSTVCKDKDSCENNPNCPIFCPEEYNNFVTSINESSGQGVSKCGIIKKSSTAPTYNESNKAIHNTPIDEEINLPDFKNILNSCLKIILFLLSLYMGYIFYQIYGETFFTIINLIIIKVEKFIHWIINGVVNAYNSRFNLVPPNQNEYQKNIAKLEKEYIDSKYEKVVRKINDLSAKNRQENSLKSQKKI